MRPARPLILAVCLALSLGLAFAPGSAGARLLGQSVGLDLTVGAYCRTEPDGEMAAPDTKDGKVQLNDLPYPFFMEGDDIAGLADIGIGIVVRLHDYTPGEMITLQIELKNVDEKPDVWQSSVMPDGRFWFGQVPDPTDHLPFGTYRFSAYRGEQELLRYDMRVREPSVAEAATTPCKPVVS